MFQFTHPKHTWGKEKKKKNGVCCLHEPTLGGNKDLETGRGSMIGALRK
jgi:hypothetical protein